MSMYEVLDTPYKSLIGKLCYVNHREYNNDPANYAASKALLTPVKDMETLTSQVEKAVMLLALGQDGLGVVPVPYKAIHETGFLLLDIMRVDIPSVHTEFHFIHAMFPDYGVVFARCRAAVAFLEVKV